MLVKKPHFREHYKGYETSFVIVQTNWACLLDIVICLQDSVQVAQRKTNRGQGSLLHILLQFVDACLFDHNPVA